jgi:hypothetical protein
MADSSIKMRIYSSPPADAKLNVACCYSTFGGVNFIVGGGTLGCKKYFRLPNSIVVSIG